MTNIDRSKNTMNLNALTMGAAAGIAGDGPNGDRPAIDNLFEATISELRRLASGIMRNEQSGHLLQPTALVNEAYLKLFDLEDVALQGRSHFMNLAARAMRRVLVDQARKRDTQKRGQGWQPMTLTGVAAENIKDELDLLALDDALKNLAELDPRAAEVVELRIFGGLKMEEIAQQKDLTRRTIQKDWRFATMWLRREFSEHSRS